MRIAYDGLCFDKRSDSRERGIGHYSLGLLTELQNSEVSGVVMVPQLGIPKEVLSGNIVPADMQQTDSSNEGIQHTGILSTVFTLACRPDCMHILSPMEHLGRYDPLIYFTTGFPIVATLFDLIPLVFKDHYLKDPITKNDYMRRLDFYKKCDRIITISKCAADDAERLLGIDSSRIDILPPLLTRKDLRKHNKLYLTNERRITEKYLLYTGGDDFRKNLLGLIEAVAEVRKTGIADIKVKVACRIRKEVVEDLDRKATRLGAQGCVEFLGYVSDEELRSLYKNAYGFIFPSLYEGLGMPVIEAMEHNLPILCSNSSSLPEVAGEAALYFSPNNIQEIAQAIYDIWTKPELRDNLVENSIKQYKNLCNNSIVNVILDSYNRAINGRSSKNLNICMVSPMPPERSGVADYSLELSKAMKNLVDMTIVDSTVKEADARKAIKECDVCIFQMGNSTAHTFMWPLLDERCDLLVLHDIYLLQYWHYYFLHEKKDADAFVDFVFELEGNDGADYIRAVLCGERQLEMDRLQLNGLAVSKAKAVLVHSRWAAEKIRQKHPWVHILTHPHPSPETLTHLTGSEGYLRKTYGIDERCFLAASFGIVADTKMPVEILHAFAQVMKRGINTKLVFVGPIDDNYKDQLMNLVNSLGLKKYVLFTGWIEQAEFMNWFNTVDCVINLRSCYKGESSGTLAQALSFSKPVIASNIGAFSEIPNNVVIKVDNQAIGRELPAALLKLTQDDLYRNKLSKSAVSFASKHTWVQGALKYIQISSMIASEEKVKEITNNYINNQELAWDAGRVWADGASWYAKSLAKFRS